MLQSHFHFLFRFIHRSEPCFCPSPVSEAILAWQLSLSCEQCSISCSNGHTTHTGVWNLLSVICAGGRTNSIISARQSALWDTGEQQVTSDLVCNYFCSLVFKAILRSLLVKRRSCCCCREDGAWCLNYWRIRIGRGILKKVLLNFRISEFLKLFFVSFVVICILRSVSLTFPRVTKAPLELGISQCPQWARDSSVYQ